MIIICLYPFSVFRSPIILDTLVIDNFSQVDPNKVLIYLL
jgi:hypothetical protein